MSSDNSPLKTPLFEQHLAAGARMVDFGGWALPVNYSSQVKEHHSVRTDVGMFDVSHMTVSDITGKDAVTFLTRLLANDIRKITGVNGKALYSCMLNEQGGVIDDLIIYHLNDQSFRMVTNAATNIKVMNWLRQQAKEFTDVNTTERPDLALIAVQGPNAIRTVCDHFSDDISTLVNSLSRFHGGFSRDFFIGRTGYTGEDGVEIILPQEQAARCWNVLSNADVQPCGLGARDTLRLEAGMSLYGSDLDEQHTPLESGLAWTVAMKDDRDFLGRGALHLPPKQKMVGLVLDVKGVLRGHQKIFSDGTQIGEITSGTFSPSLDQSIALARIQNIDEINIGSLLQVEVRKKHFPVRVTKYPFIMK